MVLAVQVAAAMSQTSHVETTEPNSPAPMSCDGDFAKLTPSNRLAHEAFNELIEQSLCSPQDYHYAAKFLHFQKLEDGDDDIFSLISDTEGSTVTEERRRQWRGHYRLSLKLLPLHPPLGWVLGSQMAAPMTHGADFLLTAATKGSRHGVGRSHARISFHRETGCLLIHAGRRSVSLHSSFGTVRLVHDFRALTEASGITVGDLQYQFEFTGLNERIFRDELEHMMKDALGVLNFEIPLSLNTSGTDSDIQMKDYTVKKVFSSGATSMVANALVKATGEAVAIKKLKRTRNNRDAIMCEAVVLQQLERIRRHVSIRSSAKYKTCS